MSEYAPDRWSIIEILDKVEGTTTIRVLASWYGGWAGSDSWKISSKINGIKDCGTHYEFSNESGSLYRCNKQCYGVSSLALAVYLRLLKQSEQQDSNVSLKYFQEFPVNIVNDFAGWNSLGSSSGS